MEVKGIFGGGLAAGKTLTAKLKETGTYLATE